MPAGRNMADVRPNAKKTGLQLNNNRAVSNQYSLLGETAGEGGVGWSRLALLDLSAALDYICVGY